jgi:hypothetical protein
MATTAVATVAANAPDAVTREVPRSKSRAPNIVSAAAAAMPMMSRCASWVPNVGTTTRLNASAPAMPPIVLAA